MKKLMIGVMMAMVAAKGLASFSYQGALRLADGSSVAESTALITFRLYTGRDATTPVWVGQQTVAISPTNGLFNVEIGDEMPKVGDADRAAIDGVLAQYPDLYLGLEVDGSAGEISPRQRILPVPSASFARNVTEAKGDFTVRGGLGVAGKLSISGETTCSAGLSIEGKLTTRGGEVVPVPIGGIIMWTQQNAPNGEEWAAKGNNGHWVICNGGSAFGISVPDLRGRFVVGANNATTGQQGTLSAYDPQGSGATRTGGEEKHTLGISEMPAHRHRYVGDDNLTDIINKTSKDVGSKESTPGGYDADSDHSGSGAIYMTSSEGQGVAHENRPPYYALYYIMRVR